MTRQEELDLLYLVDTIRESNLKDILEEMKERYPKEYQNLLLAVLEELPK